jgi:hypothetical protein
MLPNVVYFCYLEKQLKMATGYGSDTDGVSQAKLCLSATSFTTNITWSVPWSKHDIRSKGQRLTAWAMAWLFG